MPLKFNKENLLFVLITIAANRNSGRFISDLQRFSEEKLSARKGGSQVGRLSRTGLYNYLREISAKADIDETGDKFALARIYCSEHGQETAKYFKKFNKHLFDTYVLFLQRNGYLKSEAYTSDVTRIDDHPYFSLLSFLGTTMEQQEISKSRLSGDFRVYRPSLQVSGAVVVSCAQFYSTDKGAFGYRESMHYKSPWDGMWLRQLFNGYAFQKRNTFYLMTRDTSSDLMQTCVMQVMYSSADRSIRLLSGSYNGFSNNISEKIFSTGIVMVRDDFSKFRGKPISEWDHGENEGFGLIEMDSGLVSKPIVEYLNLNSYRFRQSGQ